jgi:microcystin-dependent protein
MAEPYLGELRIFSFEFAPKGWAMANGQLLPINQNQALFSLMATTYGGNGTNNFALPDMRGRTPVHFGNGHTQGERAGQEVHTLSVNEMPIHSHSAGAVSTANTAGNNINPNGLLFATSTPATLYNSTGSNLTTLAANTLSNFGGSQAHLNMQPFLTLNFCVALQGIFPSQN